jgi:hypothetical protein
VTIYGLVDPDTDEVRYVGATTKPLMRRLYGHMSESRESPHLAKSRWIASLDRRRPEVIELEKVERDWRDRERYWMAQFPNLTNEAAGGAGCPPVPKTPEHVAKVRAALTGRAGRPCTDEQRAKISDAMRGRRKSPQTVENMRRARQGEGAAMAKLMNDQVLYIRQQVADGRTRTDLAEEMGVSYATVSDIVARRRWTHI